MKILFVTLITLFCGSLSANTHFDHYYVTRSEVSEFLDLILVELKVLNDNVERITSEVVPKTYGEIPEYQADFPELETQLETQFTN